MGCWLERAREKDRRTEVKTRACSGPVAGKRILYSLSNGRRWSLPEKQCPETRVKRLRNQLKHTTDNEVSSTAREKDLKASPLAQRERVHLQSRICERGRFSPRVRKIPWRTKRQATPVFLLGRSHGQSLASCSP